MDSTTSDKVKPCFTDVLKLLGEVHEQEIAGLRAENANLKSKVGGPTRQASKSDAAVRQDSLSSFPSTQLSEEKKVQEKKVMRLSAMSLSPAALSRRPSDSSSSSDRSNRSGRTEHWWNSPDVAQAGKSSSRTPRQSSDTQPRRSIKIRGAIQTQTLQIRDMNRSDTRKGTARRRLTVTGKVFSKSFELLPRWLQEENDTRKVSFYRRSKTLTDLVERSEASMDIVTSDSCIQPIVLHPSSIKRMVWDLMSMTLLAYDIISVPFVGAFNPEPTTFLVFMTWATTVFWNLDIFMSLLTGYQSGKQIILSPDRIFLRFAKSWMLLDIGIVTFDWVLIGMGEQDSGSAARLGRSLRTLRFVRTLRLLRVLKLKRILQEIQDNINTETLSIWFGVFKIIVMLVVANHIVACGWYTVGTVDEDSGWVQAYTMRDRSIPYRYTTSLHWSLTQFTPASMEVVPHNVGERVFAVLILLIAMIAFSSFVSILTALMGELRSIHNDETRQFWLLRRYLRDWNVSRHVAKRIQHYLEYAYARQRQKVQEKDVQLLTLLSGALRDELNYEVHASALQCHAFFFHCTDEWMRFISRAIETVAYAQGDVVFACGDVGYSFHLITQGCLEYARGQFQKYDITVSGADDEDSEEDDHLDMDRMTSEPAMWEYLNEGAWIAEPVLWCSWAHLGDLQAVVESTIINVDRDKFGEVVQANTNLNLFIRRYAANFLKALNTLDSVDLTDLVNRSFSPESLLDLRDFPLLTAKRLSQLENDHSNINQLKRRTSEQIADCFRCMLCMRVCPQLLGSRTDKVEPEHDGAPPPCHSVTPVIPIINVCQSDNDSDCESHIDGKDP